MTTRIGGAFFVSCLLGLAGCGSDEPAIECGPGTERAGRVCVPTSPGGGDPGGGDPGGADPGGGDPGGGDPGGADPMTSDAGMPPHGDAGSGFSPYPPGSTGGEMGCDESMGECTAWTAALVDQLRMRRPASCTTMLTVEPRITEIAVRHAGHQASIDRVTGDSPDGNLFEQVSRAGVPIDDGAAMFASTRLGAEDVIARWAARADTMAYLSRCDQMIGAGFVTSTTSGASYVTVLLVSSRR